MLTIDAREHYSFEEVESTLSTLEREIPEVPVFISRFWLIPWLSLCKPLPLWLVIKSGDRAIGSIFICTTSYQFPKDPFSSGWFNKTGQPALDQIWIEYNDLLVLPEFRQQAIVSLLNWCKKQPQSKWILEITSSPADWLSHPDFYAEIDHIPAFRISMKPQFADFNAYLSQCSSNSRSRIRRAIKYMQQHYGELRVTSHGSMPEQTTLHKLMNLHRHRWGESAEGSGFDNPHFVKFHQALMASDSQKNYRCETLAFHAGEQCLGYTYNLIGNNTVYFYLSGIEYAEDNNRFQPGLIMHTLAVAYYARQGFSYYDFMGGDSQYKRSLSNEEYMLSAVHLYKNSWQNRGFRMLKNLARLFRAKSAG